MQHRLVPVPDISPAERARMFELMSDSYTGMSRALFDKDLDGKHFAGLLLDEAGTLQGFTTYAINPKGAGGQDYHIVFSGDTIISPEHWGSQAMAQNWCHTIGRLVAADPSKPWYWYLLSKGHRTYMYLPLFFKDYYPALEPCAADGALREVAAAVSAKLYGSCWKPAEGIVRFEERMGELRPELNEGTYQKRSRPHIGFFLARNPGFHLGEELVCVAPLHPGNLGPRVRAFMEAGMAQPLPAKSIRLAPPAV